MSTLITRLNAELRGDKAIWAIIALLSIFSILAVYSSTGTLAYRYRGGDTEAFLLKHGVILLLGLGLIYSCHLVKYTLFNRVAPYLLLLCVPLLLYTLAFGVEENQARRWIELPVVGLTFQTSDFAKLALILYVARALTIKREVIKDFRNAFVPIIVPIIMICILIAPADLSTAVLLFFTCVIMLFVGRVSMKYVILLIFLGVFVFTLLVSMGEFFPELIRVETWKSRVQEFMNPNDEHYQIQQAKIAIANGEYFGLGPGNSVQRNFLPSPYADFIYAIICEEYGLIGGGIVIFLYVLFFFRISSLITKSSNTIMTFGALAAFGLSFALIIQAFLNIAVSLHLVPVTGLTLPMISMGGTSVLFTCISFGIILSVSKYVEQTAK